MSPRAILDAFWRHRGLIRALVMREVIGRYRGSVLGMVWSFFHPVLMLAVYTFVFSVVFAARWNPASDSKTEFALVLFAGLLVFNLFSECINRSTGLVLGHPNYVKKVVFPLEILPMVALGSALVHLAIGFCVWGAFYVVVFGLPQASALLLPLVLLPLLLFTLGLSWFLASIGVYLRDTGQVVGIATTALLFLSPVFYPLTALPADLRPFLRLNPLTASIEQVRGALFWGISPEPLGFLLLLMGALCIAWAGFAWFQGTRKGFGDVI